MARWLRALVLAEDQDWTPNTHVVVHSCLQLQFQGHQELTWSLCTHAAALQNKSKKKNEPVSRVSKHDIKKDEVERISETRTERDPGFEL